MLNNKNIPIINTSNIWFIHIPKCGGTSIKESLDIDTGHETLISKKNSMSEEKWKSSFSFSFVRNPFDRLESFYRFLLEQRAHNVDEDLSFRDWFYLTIVEKDTKYRYREEYFLPCYYWLTLDGKSIDVDYVGQIEYIDRDFSLLCNMLEADKSIKHLNKTNKTIDIKYDKEMRNIVKKEFYIDFKTWYKNYITL